MVGLTYTPPLLPTVRAGPAAAGGTAPVLEILDASAAGTVQNSLSETLLAAVGSGNILSGTVTSASAAGTMTLLTGNGSEVTLRLPSELVLTVGSTVTLRVATTGITPQATLLAVDGRPVALRVGSGGGGNAGGSAPAPPPIAADNSSRGAPLPGAGSASAYAASLVAVISLEDEAALEAVLSQAEPRAVPVDDEASSAPSLLDEVIAILVHPAPARAGQTPTPVGTRYLAVLDEEASPAPAPSASTTPEEEQDGFTAQAAVIAGRIVASPDPGQTLIETALGTLALGLSAVAPGTAVRLSIRAVAAPLPGAAGPDAPVGGLLDEIFQLLAPAPAQQASSALILPPGAELLGAVWAFLAGATQRATAKDAGTALRKAMLDAGRPDLAARFDAAAADIGTVQPRPDGWNLLTLPFLGMASEQAMRVYTRKAGDESAADKRAPGHGARIVVEVSLRRLGPMQFDGLLRERRFDLVLRTETALDPELAAQIEAVFNSATAQCGSAGDISFARIGRFPFLPPAETAAGLGLSV